MVAQQKIKKNAQTQTEQRHNESFK